MEITPVEYARKMVKAYAAEGWEYERAWWQRRLDEREAEDGASAIDGWTL